MTDSNDATPFPLLVQPSFRRSRSTAETKLLGRLSWDIDILETSDVSNAARSKEICLPNRVTTKRFVFAPPQVDSNLCGNLEDQEDVDATNASKHTLSNIELDYEHPQTLSAEQSDPYTRNSFYESYKTLHGKPQLFLDTNRRKTIISSETPSDFTFEARPTPNFSSPRTLYLASCITHAHPALTLLLRKDPDSKSYNFSHQGLGDKFLDSFSVCLPVLPCVEAINVRGNRLKDTSMHGLLSAVENKTTLLQLDLSENKMGTRSANELSKYLTSSLCALRHLAIMDVELSDRAFRTILAALEINQSVNTLSLEKNRLGAIPAIPSTCSDTSSEKVIPSSALIGLESMLMKNRNIEELFLDWNMLRSNGVYRIASSLQQNSTLRILSISHNNCGDDGAMAIGDALRRNNSLEVLNLSYNSIGCRGGLVVGSGLAVNNKLRNLSMDGNSLGMSAVQHLIRIAVERKNGKENYCHLSLVDCSEHRAHLTDDSSSFDPSRPEGKYTLSLSDSFDRMIIYELLRTAATQPKYSFQTLEYAESAKPSDKRRIEIFRSFQVEGKTCVSEEAPRGKDRLLELFDELDVDASGAVDQKELWEGLHRYGVEISATRLLRVLQQHYQSLRVRREDFVKFFLCCGFAMVDMDESGSLNEEEIRGVWRLLGFPSLTKAQLDRMMIKYDIDNSGEIDEQELVYFMEMELYLNGENTNKEDGQRHGKWIMCDMSGKVWEVPQFGTLTVEFDITNSMENDTKDSTSNQRRCSERDSGVMATLFSEILLTISATSSSPTQQFDLLIMLLKQANLRLTAAQAVQGLKQTQHLDCHWARRSRAVIQLLPLIINRLEAEELAMQVLDKDYRWEQHLHLQAQLGNLYTVFLGSLTNSYEFDLNVEYDRIALEALAHIADKEKKFSQIRSGRRDTSQHGDWENFRNASLNSQPIQMTSHWILNEALSPYKLEKVSKKGTTTHVGSISTGKHNQITNRDSQSNLKDDSKILSFDYVSTTRPSKGSTSMSRRRYKQALKVIETSHKLIPKMARQKQPRNETKCALVWTRWEMVRQYVWAEIRKKKKEDAVQKVNWDGVNDRLVSIRAKLHVLEVIASVHLFSSEQAYEIVLSLPSMLRARSRAACLLFSKIVDIENFYTIFDALAEGEQRECVRKLGWLNIIDPFRPDRQYLPLHLNQYEDRELVRLLSKLALREGKASWKESSYIVQNEQHSEQTDTGNEDSTGTLPLDTWADPEVTMVGALPHIGVITLRYDSLPVCDSTGDENKASLDRVGFRLEMRRRVLSGTRLFA